MRLVLAGSSPATCLKETFGDEHTAAQACLPPMNLVSPHSNSFTFEGERESMHFAIEPKAVAQ
jgi:hypothetical protein